MTTEGSLPGRESQRRRRSSWPAMVHSVLPANTGSQIVRKKISQTASIQSDQPKASANSRASKHAPAAMIPAWARTARGRRAPNLTGWSVVPTESITSPPAGHLADVVSHARGYHRLRPPLSGTPAAPLLRAGGRNALMPSSRPDQRRSERSRPGSATMATACRPKPSRADHRCLLPKIGYAARRAWTISSKPSITMVGGVRSNPSGRAMS